MQLELLLYFFCFVLGFLFCFVFSYFLFPLEIFYLAVGFNRPKFSIVKKICGISCLHLGCKAG